MQKNIAARRPVHGLRQLTVTGICLACLWCIPYTANADIYRFVTIDGVETFTDAPLKKEAQLVIKSSTKHPRKASAKAISRETSHKPAPSLNEIIEKTVQAQLEPPQEHKQGLAETILPVNGQITSGVGMRIDPFDGSWRHHNGIDIAVPEGTPVKAVADGTVVYAGLRSGYGWTVLLEHDNGMVTLYAHNSKNGVDVGQAVRKGDTISSAGSTGRSTGPHVHFEAWQAGANVTPAFMPGSTLRVAAIPGYSRARASFRKEILADGSLLITNLPNAIP